MENVIHNHYIKKKNTSFRFAARSADLNVGAVPTVTDLTVRTEAAVLNIAKDCQLVKKYITRI